MTSISKERFLVLDTFRGIVAICVVIYHLNIVSSIGEIDFFKNSHIFVEFFFILSGFVLEHSYGYKENLNFKVYVLQRTFRLLPLHLFMLAILVLLEGGKFIAYNNFHLGFNNLPFSGDNGVEQIIPNVFLLQAWFAAPLSFNSPAWSISVEYYIYMFFFLSLILFKKFKKEKYFIIAIFFFYLNYIDFEYVNDYVIRGISCFFYGAFLYTIYKSIGIQDRSYQSNNIKVISFFWNSLESILLFMVGIVINTSFAHKEILAPVFFGIVVLVFSFERGYFSTLLKIKALKKVGLLSYSIYMTHWAILFLISSVMLISKK